MSYPPGPAWPTYREFWNVLKRVHPGLSLVTVEEESLRDIDSGEVRPAAYLHVRGKSPIGFFRPDKVDEAMTWHHLRTYADHFGIGPSEFGLTAGWPGVPREDQWIGEEDPDQKAGIEL